MFSEQLAEVIIVVHAHLRIIPLADVPPVSFGTYRRKDVTALQKRFIALLKLNLAAEG